MSTVVPYVWRGTSRPPRPRHDVAGPSLNMDLFTAEIGDEAGPEALMWRRYSGQMAREEEPAT